MKKTETISNMLFEEMNKAIRTGRAIEKIAKIEIKEDNKFKQRVINQIVAKYNLLQIKRNEIDLQKALLKDCQYQHLKSLVLDLCDVIENNKDKGTNIEQIQNSLLNLIELKEKRENMIRRQFNKEIR